MAKLKSDMQKEWNEYWESRGHGKDGHAFVEGKCLCGLTSGQSQRSTTSSAGSCQGEALASTDAGPTAPLVWVDGVLDTWRDRSFWIAAAQEQGYGKYSDKAASEVKFGVSDPSSAGEEGSLQKQTKRDPVDFRYDALNWDFIKMLAQIASYASGKYGSAEQYKHSRLEGEKSPFNHIQEHMRQYFFEGVDHDHFGDPRFHLAAIAYNAMMEYYYHTHFGMSKSVLAKGGPREGWPSRPAGPTDGFGF